MHDTLTILGPCPTIDASEPVQQTLAHWPTAGSWPRLKSLTAEQVLENPATLDQAQVVWLIDQDDQGVSLSRSQYLALIDLIQERRLTAMVTTTQETAELGHPLHPGILAAPKNASLASTALILQTLLAQASQMQEMRQEVRLLQAHQQGLCSQIHKLDEELRLAAQLQRDFLPTSLTEHGHVQFDVLYRPASYVSGDIYDIVRLDDRRLGLLIADAVGHGVPAAMLTVYVKHSLRVKEIDASQPGGYRILTAGQTLSHLNQGLIEHQAGNVRTITAWYGILDCYSLELSYSRAGHPPPLLLRDGNQVQSLDSDGGLLGVFPDEEFQVSHIQLKPGDRLLLYSDGFEVAFQQTSGKGLKTQRRGLANNLYQQELRRLAQGSIRSALDEMVQKLNEQSGSLNQLDDLTVLAACVKPDAIAAPPASTSFASASTLPQAIGPDMPLPTGL